MWVNNVVQIIFFMLAATLKDTRTYMYFTAHDAKVVG